MKVLAIVLSIVLVVVGLGALASVTGVFDEVLSERNAENLVTLDAYTAKDRVTPHGVSFTVDDDGVITVDGGFTKDEDDLYDYVDFEFASIVLEQGTYCFSGNNYTGDAKIELIGVYVDADDVTQVWISDYTDSKVMTFDKKTNVTLKVRVYSGYDADNCKIFPTIVTGKKDGDFYVKKGVIFN